MNPDISGYRAARYRAYARPTAAIHLAIARLQSELSTVERIASLAANTGGTSTECLCDDVLAGLTDLALVEGVLL